MLQDEQHQGRGELAHDQSDMLEARPEAAPSLASYLRQIRGAGPVLSTDR